jgi:hypothetical protein
MDAEGARVVSQISLADTLQVAALLHHSRSQHIDPGAGE